MNSDLRMTLKSAIGKALERLRSEGFAPSTEPSLVFRRGPPGQWSGTLEDIPTLGLWRSQVPWGDYAQETDRLLHLHHADHCGLVGTTLLGQQNLPTDQRFMNIVNHLWERQGGWDVPEYVIDAVLDEVGAFMATPTVAIAFVAPLLNFSGPEGVDSMPLLPGLRIEGLSDEQVTRIFGGSPLRLGHRSMRRPAPLGWALTGTIEERKAIGEMKVMAADTDTLRLLLDKGILALRSFRSGPVGYDFVHLEPARYTPFLLGYTSRSFGESYVPFGSYALGAEEASQLSSHGSLVAGKMHASLESACRRLAEGEIRLNPRDKIFDAVVGLEAILLADMTGQYRGEMRYRFAMNYAALQEAPHERADAFRLARDLYELRSKTAHGATLSDTVRVGGRDMLLSEAGSRACDILRTTIQRFLPASSRPEYLADEFWLARHFGSRD